PVILQGMDLKNAPTSLLDANWEEVAGAFHAGEGVLVSDTFAQVSGLRRGDDTQLRTPGGVRALRVLPIWRDLFRGDVGSITADAQRFSEIWAGAAVN